MRFYKNRTFDISVAALIQELNLWQLSHVLGVTLASFPLTIQLFTKNLKFPWPFYRAAWNAVAV